MKKKLQWLEAMRAFAACWVLLHHAKQSVTTFVGPDGVGSAVVANGYLGVDFFFVLSGFIIAFSSNRMLETGRGFGDYARARLIRIYVPYLPIGIAMLLVYQMFPGLSAANRSPGLLTSLTLWPTASPPALSVAWTLVHELLFYALFSLIFVSRRLLWFVLAVWVTLIGYQMFYGQALQSGMKYVLSPLNLCFLVGVIVFYMTRKGVCAAIAAAGGLVGVVALVLEAGQAAPERWVLSIGFAGLIVCALSSAAQRCLPGKAMLFVGAASYSIYLVHDPFLSVAIRIANRVLPGIPPVGAFMLISIAALFAGLLYYLFYERHGLALAHRIFKPSSKDLSPVSVPATIESNGR